MLMDRIECIEPKAPPLITSGKGTKVEDSCIYGFILLWITCKHCIGKFIVESRSKCVL